MNPRALPRIATGAALFALSLLVTGCKTHPPSDTGPRVFLDVPIRVVTFNIRYDNPGDGDNAWPHRRDAVASLLRFHEVDIAGLQEVLQHQLRDLESRLPDHDGFGVGRDDGATAGEFAPVFFRRDRFRLLRSGTRWLSPTPDIPGSMGWDAACPRIVTWGELLDLASGRSLFVFNTHFDHRGATARLESARAVGTWIREIAGNEPVLVTGDFNCPPDSPPLRDLEGDGRDLVLARSTSELPPHGPSTTWNGFAADFDANRPAIDHIFVRPTTSVRRHGVVTERIGNRHLSDHFAVLAEVRIGRDVPYRDPAMK